MWIRENKRKAVIIAAGLLVFAVLLGVSWRVHLRNQVISKNGYLLDTVVTITLYGSRDEQLLDDAFALCREYEELLSKTLPGSDVYHLNHADGQPVAVSDDTLTLIRRALYYSGLTDGKYDITISPLVDLWDYRAENPKVPNGYDIRSALDRVDPDNIVITGNQVQLLNGAEIDLGSIAKGYIADKLGEFLKSRGGNSAVINLGGNVLTVGGKPDGSAFRIGIQKPFEMRNETIGLVEVTDTSMVASGVYERFFYVGGQLFHHILDPDTGYPVDNGLVSVTILSESSMDGDALSTACFVLGLEPGLQLIESLEGIEAVFITDDGDEHFTSGFGTTLEFEPT